MDVVLRRHSLVNSRGHWRFSNHPVITLRRMSPNPDIPKNGEMLVIPEEDAPRTIVADGFQRVAAPPHHFEVYTTDGARRLIARRYPDRGDSWHWFAVRRLDPTAGQ